MDVEQRIFGLIDVAEREQATVAHAIKALEVAGAGLAGEVRRAVKEATGEAEGSLRRAGAWFAWKWVAIAAGGMAGVCVVAYVALAWQVHQVALLTAQKAGLQAAVVQEQANADRLAQLGGRVALEHCGHAHRLCVRVDPRESYGKGGDYFALHGY